jgi:hypothetical protein
MDAIEKITNRWKKLGADDFDIAEAIYWFCAWNYDGQGDELYSILSQSKFRPSPLSNGPDSDLAKLIVNELESNHRRN